MSKPHILILMPDQQRADCLGCAGHPVLRTPHMDRLAAEGMRFAQTATVCPICMPARASFANGLYPHNHGMWTNKGAMPAEDETFFQLLQRAGYFTAHIGKSHYYEHVRGLHLREREPYMHARGLEYVHETTGPYATCQTASYMTDAWEKKGLWGVFRQDYRERSQLKGAMVRPSPLPVEDFMDSYVGAQAAGFVRAYRDARPLCLFVGFGGPHDPWDAPGEYASMYDPAESPPPIPVPKGSDSLPEWLRSKPDFAVSSPEVSAQASRIAANYFGKISLIDRWIGEMMQAFAERKWSDDLLVVFWSDHGEMLGDHGRIRKATFHESSVRVPLILRWPGRIPAGTVSQALAEITDVFPTLLEAAGGEPSRRCLGRSLWPVLRQPDAEIRDFQLSEIHHYGRNIMLRSRNRKYVVDEQARGFMLYDLERDPQEQNNLIGKNHRLENEMRAALLKKLVETQYSM